MTQDEIIEMAKEAGLETQDGFSESVFYFAKLILEKEREACAKIIYDSWESTTAGEGIPEDWLLTLAELIKARGQA